MKYWRLALIMITVLIAVWFRDYLSDIIKVFLIIFVVGGAFWAGYEDSINA